MYIHVENNLFTYVYFMVSCVFVQRVAYNNALVRIVFVLYFLLFLLY